ncbi:MAG: ribosomal subunit interface protein, partial [Rhodospirillales bacterium]|nr:ribosomal subunit interface protein [Rhodospirillales bacterium]
MSTYEPESIAALVEPDRVHKAVYTDPALFEIEMERIFGRAWIYVGHESQVPNVGDYHQALIGKESVFMVRAQDGGVHVLFNRCPHKGAKLVAFPDGNAGKFLRCPFHGWTFRCDGSLLSVPVREGYENTRFDMADPSFAIRRVPRQQSYRGFVFASLASDGPDLETFLGGIKLSIDNFCDRAPEGEVEVAGGVFRVWQHSNWKIFFENLNDTSHPMVTHESSVNAARAQYKSLPEGAPMPFRLHIIEGNGEPYDFWGALEMVAFDHGHGYMGAIFKPPTDPVSLDYKAALEAKVGAERAREILGVQRHNSIVYPSCSPHTSFQQLRVIRPVAVDRTMVEIYTFRLKGAPESFFQRSIVYANVVNSPSSNVMPDDIEVYARAQQGLQTDGGDWVSQHRESGRDRVEAGRTTAGGLSELPM